MPPSGKSAVLRHFRQEQRKAARREREKQRERNEKGEKLARHVQRYLEQEEFKEESGRENWGDYPLLQRGGGEGAVR